MTMHDLADADRMPDERMELFHALNEAKQQLQRALDDLRLNRDLGLVAYEAQRAAHRVSALVTPFHAEPVLDDDQRLVLWHVRELNAKYGRGCTMQELRGGLPVRIKDLKGWTKELVRKGLVRKEGLGSRLVPGERHVDMWRRAEAA